MVFSIPVAEEAKVAAIGGVIALAQAQVTASPAVNGEKGYMNFLKKIIKSIAAFLVSDKAKRALETAASLVTIAAPIVREIAVVTPNKRVAEIAQAYAKYGVPFSSTILQSGPDGPGNALLNLATGLLRDRLPADKATLATNIRQTAVQLAVTAIKAK
jgi:hypothetical protein